MKEITNARKPGKVTSCQSCMSDYQTEFLGEICMHFSGGLESLDKPLLWLFPKIAVCLDCGLARFYVPERQLELVQKNLKKSA